jgi:hypothetical protein
MKKSILPFLIILDIFLTHTLMFAGPPFRTDDPIPVPFQHGELYLFSTGEFDAGGESGIGPAAEFNYGILPNTQFHIVFPVAFSVLNGEPSHVGYGDTEVGVKFCFVAQSKVMPAIATFPLVEIPTGSASKKLGNGEAQIYLPLWLQKDIGKWTMYGGGGYWINPGIGNMNWIFTGILVQYNFTNSFFLGTELFHQTPSSINTKANTGFDIGGGIPIARNYQILFSTDLGIGIGSYKQFSYYLGLYHSF